MQGQRYWIKAGAIMFQDGRTVIPTAEVETRMHREGQIRLTTGPLGTEIKWDVHSPSFASLMQAASWISELKAPYFLRFHAMGWFEEKFQTAIAATERMEEILARGDRHIVSRAFVNPGKPDQSSLPKVIRTCLQEGSPNAEFSVDCPFDAQSGQFTVARVGPHSAIGQIWGTYTTSHPCKTVGGYSDVVTEVYKSVLDTGLPHYDQVIALLRLPDNSRHWVPYHRAVFACTNERGMQGVSVVSQIASVDFCVI